MSTARGPASSGLIAVQGGRVAVALGSAVPGGGVVSPVVLVCRKSVGQVSGQGSSCHGQCLVAEVISSVAHEVSSSSPDRGSSSLPYGSNVRRHQLTAVDAGRRGRPPGSRARRAGHRELKAGSLTHLPSRSFTANAAWLVYAAIAFTLTRAAGVLVGALTPRPALPRSAPSSSPSRPGSPAPPGGCGCTGPATGHGRPPGPQLFDATCGPPAAA
jgi:hypothetical protein